MTDLESQDFAFPNAKSLYKAAYSNHNVNIENVSLMYTKIGTLQISKPYVNFKTPTWFSDKSPFPRRRQYKEINDNGLSVSQVQLFVAETCRIVRFCVKFIILLCAYIGACDW